MERTVHIRESVIEGLLRYAQGSHPREVVLLLRGKADKEKIVIEDTLIPPLATHGQHFSTFPLYMLPIDFSIIGVTPSILQALSPRPSMTSTTFMERSCSS